MTSQNNILPNPDSENDIELTLKYKNIESDNEILKDLPPLKLQRQNAMNFTGENQFFTGKRKTIQEYLKQKKEKQDNQDMNEKVKMQKKIKKYPQSFKILKIQFPELLTDKYRKKYFVKFSYLENDKIHNKTIRFGDKKKKDFIDHNDEVQKLQMLKHVKNYDNPFKSNYWRINLLNKTNNLKKNYINLLDQIL